MTSRDGMSALKLVPRQGTNANTDSANVDKGSWRAHADPEDFILEGWAQGFMVGALIIMACITIANMRRGVILHKLVLLEQLLAMSHGTFCFMAYRGYGWYLSSTATLLYCSWVIHNVVAWMKIRPFFCDPKSLFKPTTGKWVRNIYLSTLAASIGPIILQIYDNFRFFNNINNFYTQVRPYEPLFRDPWWVFTCLALFYVIQKSYGTGAFELVKSSPRFGILLAAIALSMIFTTLDIAASIHNFIGSTDGINPWWKLSLVFKCLTDTIMLDDFKTELKRLGMKRIQREELRRQSTALVLDDDEDDVAEVEFADALNTRAPLTTGTNLSPRESPDGRPRQDSLKRGGPRAQTGKGGTRISHLPGLKSLHFSKKKEKADEESYDLEKQETGSSSTNVHDHSSSNERVDEMRGSLGSMDFHTTPAGI